jgi:hypothetical protein
MLGSPPVGGISLCTVMIPPSSNTSMIASKSFFFPNCYGQRAHNVATLDFLCTSAPFNGEMVDRSVPDPYSSTGGKIVVTASVRDDPFAQTYRRGPGTGWLPHTLRGYISRTAKAEGWTLERDKVDGVTCFRIRV